MYFGPVPIQIIRKKDLCYFLCDVLACCETLKEQQHKQCFLQTDRKENDETVASIRL